MKTPAICSYTCRIFLLCRSSSLPQIHRRCCRQPVMKLLFSLAQPRRLAFGPILLPEGWKRPFGKLDTSTQIALHCYIKIYKGYTGTYSATTTLRFCICHSSPGHVCIIVLRRCCRGVSSESTLSRRSSFRKAFGQYSGHWSCLRRLSARQATAT